MQTIIRVDPPKRVHRLTLIFAISGLLIENNSRFLFNFTTITYQLKNSVIPQGHHHACENTKIVSMYFGSGILYFICKMP